MSLSLFGMDLFTLTVHNIAPGVLAGMIANSGDRRFCKVMGTIVERLKQGGPPVNHDLQKAVRRAYLQATLCVCHQCMADQGVKPSLIRRNISDILFPSETARALDPVVHRLIAGFVRETAEAETALCARVVEVVEKEMSRVGDEMDTAAFRELEKVAPHAERLLDAAYVSGEQKADISNWLSWHYRK